MSDALLLEVFGNPEPGREYEVEIESPEFTSLCPKTGQPDFGVITVTYCPDEKCIELKSLKLYLQGYRNEGIFYEAVVNRILNDLVGVSEPSWMMVVGQFKARGGITTTVSVEYEKEEENWG